MTGPRWETLIALGTFSFVLESEKCGCQQRNAINGMGCTSEADQTSKVGQFLRLHHNTSQHMEETLYSCLVVESLQNTVRNILRRIQPAKHTTTEHTSYHIFTYRLEFDDDVDIA